MPPNFECSPSAAPPHPRFEVLESPLHTPEYLNPCCRGHVLTDRV